MALQQSTIMAETLDKPLQWIFSLSVYTDQLAVCYMIENLDGKTSGSYRNIKYAINYP